MSEVSGALGWVAVALMFAALAAWLSFRSRPALQPLSRLVQAKAGGRGAAALLLTAMAVAAVAAVLAVGGWMVN